MRVLPMDVGHKLEHLLPHWIEHNVQHAASYREWAGQARAAGLGDAAERILAACEAIDAANRALTESLDLLRKTAP